MKLICNLLNMLAVVMVLLLGTVAAHAGSGEHQHTASVETGIGHTADESAVIKDHHQGGAAMHCGAPILGPETPSFDCTIHVATVAYPLVVVGNLQDFDFKDLRPPRR
ncbi:hypothetical protein [Devosia sp. LjRoot3]|uniref:hypothetical protein n=1 Tax=Devosia sp. LjRoot3 TaxID=3342319 RepID=UPI003ECEF90B